MDVEVTVCGTVLVWVTVTGIVEVDVVVVVVGMTAVEVTV